MRIRTWFKKTVIGRLVWRIIIGVIGGAITVTGAIALVGPGPGFLIVLAGLGILATEFAWAARVMARTRTYAQKAADKTGMPKWAQYALVAAFAVFSIIAILYLHSTGKL